MSGLIDFLRPDYPQLSRDATGVRRTYAFRGLTASIVPALPKIGATWLDFYPVADVRHNPIGTSDWSDAIVETYQIEAQATAEKADDQYPFWEIDQVQIEKPLRQHPAFINFTVADWQAIDAWDAEIYRKIKSDYGYFFRNENNETVGSLQTLTGTTSTGQKAYAYLRQRGVESFLDFAPVVRRNSRYLGSSAPDVADAGQKTTAPAYAPAGYEWIKTADRVTKTGARGIEWIRQEEWTGSRKVFLDKDSLFS